jgi:hypothetical protein
LEIMQQPSARWLVALVLALCAPAALQGQLTRLDTVYDNTRFPVLINGVDQAFIARTNEIGDEISLAGSARKVRDFAFEYFSDFKPDGDETMRVRFYANDGPGIFPKPGTLLWDSGFLPVATNRYNRQPLSIPDVLVPDTFTWSISFGGVTQAPGDQMGILLYSPPTIGALLNGGEVGSYDDYWRNTSGIWSFFRIQSGAIPANFAARVLAVPEPAPLLLGLLAGVGWLSVRRWRGPPG